MQARKVLRSYLTNWTSSVGIGMRASTSRTSSTPTFTWSLPKGMWCTVVDPSQTFPKETRRGELSSICNPHLFDALVSGSYPKGSTQLPFVLTLAAEWETSGSRGGKTPRDCIWDCIWLKDNITCLVTFSLIDCSSLSLIFCVSFSLRFCLIWSNSYGLIDIDVWEPAEAGPKYCLIITPTLAARTRPGCSARLMSNRHILMSMGHKATLCGLFFQGILL